MPKPLDHRIRNREYDRRRGSARKRGYDSRWDKARRLYLFDHPLCRMCHEAGNIVPATVVDHINPHKGDQLKFWDRNNWQPLCKSHHDLHKQRQERGRSVQEIGEDGWPVQ